MSIDSSNARPDNCYETANTFNYIDTYVEYVTEVLLKYENAIPECGKSPQKQWQQHKLCEIMCYSARSAGTHTIFYKMLKEIFIKQDDRYTYQFVKEIFPPPKFPANIILHINKCSTL